MSILHYNNQTVWTSLLNWDPQNDPDSWRTSINKHKLYKAYTYTIVSYRDPGRLASPLPQCWMCQREKQLGCNYVSPCIYDSCSRHVITRSNDFLCSLNSKEFTLRDGYIEYYVTPSAVKPAVNYERSLQLKKIKSLTIVKRPFLKIMKKLNRLHRFREVKQ